MDKLKCIFFILIVFICTIKVEALDIQYGNVLGYKNSDILIEYYGIENKTNFICNVINYECKNTKETTFGKITPKILSKSIKNEIKNEGGSHSTLSKNGTWLSYLIPANQSRNNRTYVIKKIKENKNYTISSNLPYWDLIKDSINVFQFSPDEKTLIYLDDKDGMASLYKVNLKSLKNSRIESIKVNATGYIIANFIFTDSQTLYYVANIKENPYKWSLYRLDLKTGVDKIIETDVSYDNKIIKVGSSLIFNRQQEKGYGPESYNVITKKLGFFKVPGINTEKITRNEEPIKIAKENNIDINGVLMTPPSYNREKTYPVLIWLHGGPLRQTSYGYHPYHSYGIYDSILKLLQKNDVIVLKLDYRGSFGFGRDYSEQIKGSVGKGDVDDVMEAVKYLKNKYNVKDFYLAGNSYGGYMSLRTIVEYPNTFKGIFSINGVTDWESLLIKLKTSIFNTQFYGLPNENNRNLYDQASIISRIGNLRKQRVEITQSEADQTIPLWQSILLSDKLKDVNKNVNLVTYKEEDHIFKYEKNIGDMCVRLFGLIGIPTDKECTN